MKELTMEEMHAVNLTTLKFIDKLCQKLNLRYYVAFGSLIGAVRHNGFIPWDDDLDIMMWRKDMESLIHYMESHVSEIAPYRIFTQDNNEKYPYGIPRVCDTNYLVLHKNKPDCGMGMFVDIYPLDSMGDKPGEGANDYKKIKMLIKISYLATDVKYPGAGNKLKTIIKYPIYLYAKNKGLKYYTERILSLSKKHWNENSKYVGVTVWEIVSRFERDWFGDGVKIPFENWEVTVPKNYDAVLRVIYGDYMKLPPTEKQHPTHAYVAYKK